MATPDLFPSRRWDRGRMCDEVVRLAGVGGIVTGAVLSLSCPASQVHSAATVSGDGGAVTGGDGWDPCHSYCGNGGLTPPVLSTVEEAMGIQCPRTASSWAAGPFVPCAEG